jgi:hypothetical protein
MKIQNFGVTSKRFVDKKNIPANLIDFNIKEPNFKKISKASQEYVAFGKSKK